ncbi:hypothetical protein PI125_g11506 [Phytophthora idaei]|nr:hypothetical protein PI125_g11506 [Phytophthora idaei]
MHLPGHAQLGVWLTGDRVPRHQGLVAVGSRQYAEWQNLSFHATTDEHDELEDLIEELSEFLSIVLSTTSQRGF